jgi:hypothetical protein
MTTLSTKPTYVSLHRLGQLSGKARNTLLLRMRDGELVADAMLDLGGQLQPLFVAQRVAELKRLPSRKAAPALNPML